MEDAAGAPGPWGVSCESIHVERKMPTGEISFSLDLTGKISVLAGTGGPNRIPMMGPSGAGKSTVLNLVSCTSLPQNPEGRVCWTFPDGKRFEWGPTGPSSSDLIKLRQKYFGYAFQTASLQPQLTIGENLTFGLENTGVSPARAKERALEALAQVFSGDEERARKIFPRYDTEVSGGERQRISLMQALIRDPYVLFADEPTGSLDKQTRGHVMRLLTDWLAQKPMERMFLWVTHHDRDPQDNDATMRIWVADGGVEVQELQNDRWVAIDKASAEAVIC